MENKISNSDKTAIIALREAVKDLLTPYYDTDFNLLRWLQGHDFKMDIVVFKLRKHLILRKCWKLDEVHLRESEVMQELSNQYHPGGCLGPSGRNSNTIAYLEPMGYLDFHGLIRLIGRINFYRSRIHVLELYLAMLMKKEAETGQQWHLICVFDIAHLNNHGSDALDAFQRHIEIILQNYVELFSKTIVINTPSFFYLIWKVLSPFLPTRTLNKVDIVSHKTDSLLSYIAPDVLPRHYGGTRVDDSGDPRCQRFIRYEKSSIPESMFRDSLDVENGSEFIVAAGKSKSARVRSEGGGRLSWVFRASSTFTFAVFYAVDEEEHEQELVYPEMRNIVPTYCVETDSIPNPRAGFYDFRFSNDAAWFKDLHIHYRIDTD